MFLSLLLSHFSLLPLLILLLSVFAFTWLFSFSKTSKHRLPSPPRLPIIGNFHQLGLLPHRSLQALSRKYGPLMLLHLGNVPTLVASSAQVACEILKNHDLVFANRGKSTTASIMVYNRQDIAFAPYGEHWRQVRSIAVLHLLSRQRVQSYQHVREEETALMIKTIRERHGSIVNLSELLYSLSNDVVCRIALGRKYDLKMFADLMERYLELLGTFCVGDYVPLLSWVDRLSRLEGRAKKVAKEFDEFLEGVIEEHVHRESDRVDQREDLVDILLKIQREDTIGFSLNRETVKAIIMDMFTAGTDTTSTMLEWAVSELIKNPRVMEKLQKEAKEVAQGDSIITEDNLERMQYLKAVVKEALRLHAPVPLLVPRKSTQDIKLMGHNIKADTQVIVNAWAIARDPHLWEEPEEFRPERFLNSSIDYKGHNFEFIPFGSGRRGCPGIHFGMTVGELALANLVYKFNLSLPGANKEDCLDMNEIYGLSLKRKSPLLLLATPQS